MRETQMGGLVGMRRIQLAGMRGRSGREGSEKVVVVVGVVGCSSGSVVGGWVGQRSFATTHH